MGFFFIFFCFFDVVFHESGHFILVLDEYQVNGKVGVPGST
jgi:hypothetical protein